MIIDIIIKTFNRPYYLERCIRSIYQFVEGDYRIKVLDDGTAPEYLAKISALFPKVFIYTSPLYESKWTALKEHVNDGKKFNLFTIPTKFWVENIINSSDYFLLLEDDIWLTGKISLTDSIQIMKSKKVIKLKISWQGSSMVNQGKIQPLSKDIEEIIPTISLKNKIALTNRYKIALILNRLKLIKFDFNDLLPFYSIYYVASAFFEKRYWLYLWDEAGDKVDENFQLTKAFQWFKKNKSRYGKMKEEKAKTSYITSSTNTFTNINFDMIHFNHHINDAWLSNKFDVMENFPKDYSLGYIKSFLENANDIKCSYEKWLDWISKFKSTYKNLGCEVD